METPTQEVDINEWLHHIIEGVGGMNDYEKYELVIWNESERLAAARWTLKCLANPKCEGSAYVLEAISERRREVGTGPWGGATAKDKVLEEAVCAIYFEDSSDFRRALWSIVRLLAPSIAELLETDPQAAFEAVHLTPDPTAPGEGAT